MCVNQLFIRKATVKDSALVASFSARTFQDAFGSKNTKEDMEVYLSANFNEEYVCSQLLDPSSTYLLAFQKDRLIGYSMLHAGEVPDEVSGLKPIELVRIYIDGMHKGKGYGSRLMEAIIQVAGQGLHDVMWLGVWEQNKSAIAFYTKWGFDKVGMKEFILGSDVQHDLIMERRVKLAA
jgi:ribosomal protein S18 acetylase RimI-like enzyme